MIKGEINKVVADVTQSIIQSADISIPKSSGLLKRLYKPWWNEKCETTEKKQQKTWGIFHCYPTIKNYIAFKEARAKARIIQHKSQCESWIGYVSSITSVVVVDIVDVCHLGGQAPYRV